MSAPLPVSFKITTGSRYRPKSNLDTIHLAYGKLAEKYHPRNDKTGDQNMFDAVNLAYEVLCDSGLRSEFDKLKGVGEDKAEFKFSGLDFFAALEHETALTRGSALRLIRPLGV